MRRNKNWGLVLTGLLIIFITIALEGCGAPSSGPSTPTQTSSSSSQSSSTPPAQPKAFKVGDTIQLGDNKMTVNSVTKSNGTDFDKPKAGNEYVIIKVTIENAGKDNISYNPLDFAVQNNQGQINDMAFTTVDQDTALNSGDLAPGGKVSGTISFEEPKKDPKLQLQYTPGFLSDQTIKINLQ